MTASRLFSDALRAEIIAWATESQWAEFRNMATEDITAALAGMPDYHLAMGVQERYDGGLWQFLQDGERE